MADPISREVDLQHSSGRTEHWEPVGLEGLSVVLPPTVYPPREDTALLDECIASLGAGEGSRMLELGTGSGVVAIASALRGWQVTCCDVNPLAVAACRGNASQAGVQLEVLEGGLDLECEMDLDSKYDAIVWNLPYLDPPEKGGPRLGPLEDAGLIDLPGESGWGSKLLDALESNPDLLNEGGLVILLHTNNERGSTLQTLWRSEGWATRVVGEKRLGGDERLTCFAAWKPFGGRPVERRKVVDSTNLRLLEEGGSEGRCLVATQQMEGRGQRGRKWLTREGDFAGSWILPTEGVDIQPGKMQLDAAIAVADTIACSLGTPLPSSHWTCSAALIDAGIEVRWPNDVWIGEGKLAGVLVEGKQQRDEHRVVLGIGLNIDDSTHSELQMAALSELQESPVESSLVIARIDASVASIFERVSRLPPPSEEGLRRAFWSLSSSHLGRGVQLHIDGRDSTPCSIGENGSMDSIDNGSLVQITNVFERSWN